MSARGHGTVTPAHGTNTPLRIALVNLTGGGMSGGYRTYLRELVPRLASHPEVAALSVALPPESGFTSERLGAPCTEWPHGARVEAWVRDFVREQAPDVVFIPTARWCDSGRPTAVMVRNMEPLVRPWSGNSLRGGVRNMARQMAARRACRRADRVIAVSGFVREFLASAWKIERERIGVVRHGVAAAPSPDSLERPAAVPPMSTPFVFTAGSIRPARGLEDLVGAMAELADVPALRLVVAGHVDAGAERYARLLRQGAETAGVTERITWSGPLGTDAMSWCLTNAACFVMTSRVEACPNTALEAMAHGAISVATTLPPMPEFFGACATYYAAGDARGLARAIRAVLALAPGERDRLRNAAIARGAGFRWGETADRTVLELRRTIGAQSHDAGDPDGGTEGTVATAAGVRPPMSSSH